jgi:hypothetical protein
VVLTRATLRNIPGDGILLVIAVELQIFTESLFARTAGEFEGKMPSLLLRDYFSIPGILIF